MKKQSLMHTLHRNRHHDLISLFTISLLISGLAIIIYLLSFCHFADRNRGTVHLSSSPVRAEAKGENISEAVSLSTGSTCRVSLAPYSHRYYYVTWKDSYSIQIISGSNSVKLSFYSDRGKRLSVSEKNRTYHFDSGISAGDRIFIKCTNTSPQKSTVTIRFHKFENDKTKRQKITVPKSKKTQRTQKHTKKMTEQTPHSSKNNSAHNRKKRDNPVTHSPVPPSKKPADSVKKISSLTVTPHFLHLTCGSEKKIYLSSGKASLSIYDCTYFSTDSSVISIKGNTVMGKSEGTAILYFKLKQSTACGSCLVRVIN